jgi:hypothetical protein
MSSIAETTGLAPLRAKRARARARVEIIDEFATNGTSAGAGAGTRHRNCCE